jgi:LTXXQ motif family protein
MKSFRTSAAAVLLLATAMIGGAAAQDQSQQQGAWSGPMMGPGGMMGYDIMGPGMMGGYDRAGPGMMPWSGSGQAMCGAMAGHIEGRLAFVKTELKITSAQEPLWNTYAAAARDSANTMLARCTTMMGQRGTSTVSLPDRLDQNEQLIAAQLDAMRATNKALKPLYADFTDSQKQSANQLFWGPMGMM